MMINKYSLNKDQYLQFINLFLFSGCFIEFRNGMINVSPIGRNCRLGKAFLRGFEKKLDIY
jgi:hypothetical protein